MRRCRLFTMPVRRGGGVIRPEATDKAYHVASAVRRKSHKCAAEGRGQARQNRRFKML